MRQRFLVLSATMVIASSTWAAAITASEDDRLLVEASRRIEQHRQVDGCVRVVDAAGKPLADARVTIEQTSHAFLFGCNIFLWGRAGNEKDEQAYRQRFADLMNYATLPFYWPAYERRRGEPAHERTEQVARWCREHNIAAKGHPLAWNFADPPWLPEDLDEIRQLQMQRIADCVGRFRELIDRWDVVNEATHFEREAFRKRAPRMTAMWEATGRVPFVRQCFTHARRANPQATLLINDYRTDEAYEALLRQLTDQGKPIFDVIGIQSHMHGGVWNNRRIWEVCERFARFGVPLHFTETTILSGKPGWRGEGRATDWPSTEEGEKRQADEVERFYTMVFSHPAVEALTWWDFSDRGAWQGAPAGFLRHDMSPKPAYERLHSLVKGRWWTRTSGLTAADGTLRFRGFRGRYRVQAAGPDGAELTREMLLDKGQPNVLTLSAGSSGGGSPP